jgi:hypothetical protein
MKAGKGRGVRGGLAFACGLAGLPTTAFAVVFNLGPVEAQLDSSFTLDSAWSTAKADHDLVGANNGGRGQAQLADDGRLNFRRGETFSKRLQGEHALELHRGETGMLLSGRYWYDFELKDESRAFKAVDDGGRDVSAQASGGEWLEAFVYHNYRFGEQPGAVRVGRQRLDWGEHLFLRGIDVNPLEASALRGPGDQVSDALRPVALLQATQSLTDSVSLEAFYQAEWRPDALENCGTFFATSDVLADGCATNLRLGSGVSSLSAGEQATLTASGVGVDGEGVLTPRGHDREARDGGQWGLALRWFADTWDSRFGAYVLNQHSRSAILSTSLAAPAVYAAAAGSGALAPMLAAGRSRYFVEYPEDVRLYGLSFASTLPTGTTWRGEIGYRPNAPVQLSVADLLAAVGETAGGVGSPLQGAPGQDLHGYRRQEVTQAITSFSHIFDLAMGASRFTLTGEFGAIRTGGLEDSLRHGRDPVFGREGSGGFTTRSAWGYRAHAVWDYENALPGIDLHPSLAWSHDVHGYSPAPEGVFQQGRKALSVGVSADYRTTYSIGLAYTDFFGSRYSTWGDRDYAALTVGMRF